MSPLFRLLDLWTASAVAPVTAARDLLVCGWCSVVIGFLGDKSAARYQPIAASIAIDQLFSAVGLAIMSQIRPATIQISTCINLLGKPTADRSRRLLPLLNRNRPFQSICPHAAKSGIEMGTNYQDLPVRRLCPVVNSSQLEILT
jgi:hypothetical protein